MAPVVNTRESPKQGTTLTLITLGTGEHHEKMQSILTQLKTSIEVESPDGKSTNQYVHLIDGPGGIAPKQTDHPMLGTYDFSCEINAEGQLISHKPLKSKNKTHWLSGLLAGIGFRDAISESLQVVDALVNANKTPLVLNMYGFSRGADQQLRIANAIYAKYGDQVRLNILSIDPVAGLGRRRAKKAKLIPPNVNIYEVVLMKHEIRPEFEAQDKSRVIAQDPSKTQIKYRIYSGDHSHGVYFRTNQLIDSAHLVWDDVHHFAKTHGTRLLHKIPHVLIEKKGKKWIYNPPGTKLSTTKDLSSKERLVLYTRMINKEEEYSKTSSPTLANYQKQRDFLTRKTDYFLHGTDVFQDRHHMELFNELYPHFFDYFFQQNIAKTQPNLVMSDIVKLQEDDLLHGFLKEKMNIDVLKFNSPADLPKPMGLRIIANQFYNNQQNELWRLWESVQSITHAVITDYDRSTSKKAAHSLLKEVTEIITGDLTEKTKVDYIKYQIEQHLRSNKNQKGLFTAKLAVLIDDPNKQIVKRISHNLEKFLIHRKNNSLEEKNLLRETLKYLTMIQVAQSPAGKAAGNDVEAIRIVLNIALQKAHDLRKGHINGPLEKKLRQAILEVSGYPSPNPNSNLHIRLQRFKRYGVRGENFGHNDKWLRMFRSENRNKSGVKKPAVKKSAVNDGVLVMDRIKSHR